MEHKHEHSPKSKNIRFAFFANFFFTILEIVGGLLTNSVAILSDALHDLGDTVSLGLAWYFEQVAKKKADQRFSFGYARFSLLGALVNSFVLLGGSIYILTKAVPRLLQPQEVHETGMLFLSVIGIIVNGVAVLRLKRGQSLNEKVVSWHLLEDVLGWIAVFVVSLLLLFFDLPILDPLLSIGITLFVLYNVVKNLKEVLRIFLQGVPKHLSIEDLEDEIRRIAGIQSVYHTHIWSLEGEKNQLTTHVLVDPEMDWKEITTVKENVRKLARQKGIGHVTIEVDYEDKNKDENESNKKQHESKNKCGTKQ
ncbi:MAG TPA: cation transporter [Eubacteriaceae bacterium]|nr:cation transporter [Eubacteriaceae bacterium]